MFCLEKVDDVAFLRMVDKRSADWPGLSNVMGADRNRTFSCGLRGYPGLLLDGRCEKCQWVRWGQVWRRLVLGAAA